jgi:hypothetical protein
MQGLQRMPGSPPGYSKPGSSRPGAEITLIDRGTYYSYDPHQLDRDRDERLRRAIDELGI